MNGFDHDADAHGFDEELRTQLHAMVSGIRPSHDALDHIREAIPARRRRRQVVAGVVAVLVVAGGSAAGVTTSGGNGGPAIGAAPTRDVGTSASSAGQGQASPHSPRGAGGRSPGDHASTAPAPGVSSPAGAGSAKPLGPQTSPTTGANPAVPACPAGSLRAAAAPAITGGNGTPVRGSVRVTTTSAVACSVSGPPAVAVADATGAVAAVSVVTASSPSATQQILAPAPAGPVVLAPGGAYEFRFAWVAEGSGASAQPCAPPSTGAGSGWVLTYSVADSAAAATPSAARVVVATTTLPGACGSPTLYITDVEPVPPATSPTPSG